MSTEEALRLIGVTDKSLFFASLVNNQKARKAQRPNEDHIGLTDSRLSREQVALHVMRAMRDKLRSLKTFEEAWQFFQALNAALEEE